MNTQTLATKYEKLISVTLTLEQVAFSLNQLSETDLEVLKELVDRKLQKTILSRGKQMPSQYRRCQTISLKNFQEALGSINDGFIQAGNP